LADTRFPLPDLVLPRDLPVALNLDATCRNPPSSGDSPPLDALFTLASDALLSISRLCNRGDRQE